MLQSSIQPGVSNENAPARPPVRSCRSVEGCIETVPPVSFGDSVVDVDSVVSGAALFSMLGFIGMLFIGCFDAGLIA